MDRPVVLRIDYKAVGKTWRSKPNSGSAFKNWNIYATDEDGGPMILRAPRAIWNELNIDGWYDLTMETTRVRATIASDWVTSVESNGYRKKLKIMEANGIAIEIGAIILEYAFPMKAMRKLVRTSVDRAALESCEADPR